MPDLPEEAVTAAEDAYRCAHTSGVPRHEIARIVAVAAVEAAAPAIAAQERADERRKIAAQVREIVEDDGPIPLENWRAFKGRHKRLVTGDSVVAVLLAVADEIEAVPERTETDGQ